jgi:putative membrane protein
MRKTLYAVPVGLAFLGIALAQKDDRSGKGSDDQQFVQKASAAGLAEVNFGRLAAKQASSADVRKFGQHMVDDHSKANEQLLKVANKKRYTVARAMDAEHERMFRKLSELKGSEFDREYMAGQLKAHKEAVALFEKASKNGKDEDLKQLAEKTLPTLKEHLKMAQETNSTLKKGK